MIIKVAGIVLCEVFIGLLLKKYSPEYVVLSQLAAVVILFFLISSEINNTVSVFESLFMKTGLPAAYINILFRTAGIAIIVTFASQLCRDAGDNTTAINAEFTGRVLIIACVIPVLRDLTELITQLVEKV